MKKEFEIQEILKTKGGYLFHRESQTLEFKEQFNLAALPAYFRDFAAFSNNRGGNLIFGVTDTPRNPAGMNKKSLEQFEKIDAEYISQQILEVFSSNINWSQHIYEVSGKYFGVFSIEQSVTRPVIVKKDTGKGQLLRNGDILFRYGGRTQRIQSAELEFIISERITRTNKDWIEMVQAIGDQGPQNTIFLKSEDDIHLNSNAPIVLDNKLAENLKFIKEGDFKQKNGSPTLKLVGEVVPYNQLEIEKVVKENWLKDYPYSASDLVDEIRKLKDDVKQHEVWTAIKENDIKQNENYSVYNFRNNKQMREYQDKGKLPSSVPSIYNESAVNYLVKILNND